MIVSQEQEHHYWLQKKMGLDYFGCDLDKDYVEFMKSRMSKEEVWDKFGG